MSGKVQRIKIGIAVGHGTGSELVDIFKRVIDTFGMVYHGRALQIEFRQSSRIYHSYLSLMSIDGGQTERDREISRDAMHYENFCRDAAAEDIHVIFRTAITAQSLYLVRLHLMAVKVELFKNSSAQLLLIRDQAQGFYSGLNDHSSDNEVISRTCKFSRGTLGQILSYSLQRARQVWGDNVHLTSISMVYKHHLFNGIFDVWAREWSEEHSIKVDIIQPDTMNRNLLAHGFGERQIIIASNEYGDIMENVFLDAFNLGPQELSCSENVYLLPDLGDLSEFQTVHGSADDLVGKNTVNPSATIRAVAAILERYGECKGIQKTVDEILNSMLERNAVTPDQGGNLSTTKFVDLLLKEFERASTGFDPHTRGGRIVPTTISMAPRTRTIHSSTDVKAKL